MAQDSGGGGGGEQSVEAGVCHQLGYCHVEHGTTSDDILALSHFTLVLLDPVLDSVSTTDHPVVKA